MEFYRRKLYAWIQAGPWNDDTKQAICISLQCLRSKNNILDSKITALAALETWWHDHGKQCCEIATSSDRINIEPNISPTATDQVCHPISGQYQTVTSLKTDTIPSYFKIIKDNTDPKYVFWWLWRFSPEWDLDHPDSLLNAAHPVLPDCSWHSYQNTVSALAGSISYNNPDSDNHPYLFLFSFSPIQDFIKASRKFLDFWAGSYLLHYLSAQLCWDIAQKYGPDTLIVPSLWGQEIIDTLWIQQTKESQHSEQLTAAFHHIGYCQTPITRFEAGDSNSLSTAGFPNMITALVPTKQDAEALGQYLSKHITTLWCDIGDRVQKDIRNRVSHYATGISDPVWHSLWQELNEGLPNLQPINPSENADNNKLKENLYKQELESWQSKCVQDADGTTKLLHSGWTWRKLWEAQLENTWEPYWTAVPLGAPNYSMTWVSPSDKTTPEVPLETWRAQQNAMAQPWPGLDLPTSAEKNYLTMNVGTWWGSLQQRLRISLQTVKNTRTWHVPAAPGSRSTVSGQFSAIHPNYNYSLIQTRGEARDLREGGGLPIGSLRFFWMIMARVYPGLFNGSERLNALEVTKRMAWQFGGVAENLGISTQLPAETLDDTKAVEDLGGIEPEVVTKVDLSTLTPQQVDYDRLIRFPNLSSIASARYLHDAISLESSAGPKSSKPRRYWNQLARILKDWQVPADETSPQTKQKDHRYLFASRTRCRASQVPKTDRVIHPEQKSGQNYNGVMFSSKWLADDMGLQDRSQVQQLRRDVDHVHQKVGFTDGSPADWWTLVLADGDGMGQYVSGSRLHPYEKYLDAEILSTLEQNNRLKSLKSTRKRMGPATHLGLNRALLDFSNRLVPYLTEHRFCGKLIYSGGDDVMAVLPVEDLPEYLMSLRAAWCGEADPFLDPDITFNQQDTCQEYGDYWHPQFHNNEAKRKLPNRPLFTMGHGATLSMGVVIAHKSVPLSTVLESLWEAEKDRAKEMPNKNGLCFRVIYGGGNQLEALMNGNLLAPWWNSIYDFEKYDKDLAPVFYRLAEELPKRAMITPDGGLVSKAAEVIMSRREAELDNNFQRIAVWLTEWENWARKALQDHWQNDWYKHYIAALQHKRDDLPLGTHPDDLGKLLRFTAFWISERVIRWNWLQEDIAS